jgi:hypothetical protein
MSHNPLPQILRSARRIGEEFCWPATEALSVIEAFQRLGLVVLGAELWRFEGDDAAPTVVGWTDYEVPPGPPAVRVAEATRLVTDILIAHSGDLDLWVNLTWEETNSGNLTQDVRDDSGREGKRNP